MRFVSAILLCLFAFAVSAQAPADFQQLHKFMSSARNCITLFDARMLVDKNAGMEVQPEFLKLSTLLLPINDLTVSAATMEDTDFGWIRLQADRRSGVVIADTLRRDGPVYRFVLHREGQADQDHSETILRGVYDPRVDRLLMDREVNLSRNGKSHNLMRDHYEFAQIDSSAYLFYVTTNDSLAFRRQVEEHRLYFSPNDGRGIVSRQVIPASLYSAPPLNWEGFARQDGYERKFYWRKDRGGWEYPERELRTSW